MEKRTEELLKLKAYTEDIDKDLTMILQSLQWDRKLILEHSTMVTCKLNSNHRVLADKVEKHEQECSLRHNGYTIVDQLLPDPLNAAADTLIKLTKQDIMNTIDNAAKMDPTFQRVCIDTLYGSKQVSPLYIGSGDMEPQTLGRLQCAYTADERRAIHDAVVSAAPSYHDLTDLALPSGGEDGRAPKTKSRTEILAELRDMRRRRTKYRVAAKSKNYSDVLRDVIKSQMELYNEVLGEAETKPDVNKLNVEINKQNEPNDEVHYKASERDRYEDRRDRRETDRDQSRGDRSDRDYRNKSRRNVDDQSRDRRSRDDCSDRRYDSRNYSGHRPRGKSKEIKVEASDDNNDHSDKSANKSYEDKYKEREYEREEKRKERHDERYRRDDDRKRRKHRDRSREKNDPDVERARNLIREIKRELESAERSQGDEDSVEVDRYRDYSRDHRHEGDESKSYRHTNLDHSRNDRSRDRFDDRRSRDYKMDKERRDKRENREKHLKSKVDRHKESYRSEDYETKRSRTEDKHKRYYEIYSELDRRRNKGSNDDND